LGRSGMTLVELMVAIAITGIIMTISITVFVKQYDSYRRNQGAKTAQTDSLFGIEMLKEDIGIAGWGVTPKMAFYVEDGGSNGTDRIYINDVTVLNPRSEADLEKMVDTTCAACIPYGDESPTVTVSGGNATNNVGAKVPVANVPAIVWVGGKTTRNWTKANGELNATSSGNGTMTPAIEYCADGGNSSRCDGPAALWTLRKFSRSTGGQMVAVASDVADLQATYYAGTTEYGARNCSTGTNCSMTSFNAASIQWVKIFVVTRSRDKTRPPTDPSSCRPAMANRLAGTNKTADCGYEYRTYTTTIGPLGNVAH